MDCWSTEWLQFPAFLSDAYEPPHIGVAECADNDL